MIDDIVRGLITKTCELPVDPITLADDADLYAAGLTSFASVQLMLALEEEFDIEFPDQLLNRKTFATLRAISDAVALLRSGREAA
nr:acyl carrier protein [Rhodoblastus acidophilus]